MMTISLCMIVKDEEDTLEACLSPLCPIVDEIVIVDTGSTDCTKEVAARFGACIYDFEWIDDFAAARNYAFEQATKEYMMWLDADDVLGPEDCVKLLELKERTKFAYDSVTMSYQLTFDEAGKAVYSLRRNRLVRRACGFKWIGAVHEYLAVSGNIYHSDIAVKHNKRKEYSDRNLRIYINRRAKGELFTPRDQYYFANELYDHQRYYEAAVQYEKFLQDGLGWIEDRIAACHKLEECYRQLGETEKSLEALLRTLLIDAPRAELCCKLGAYFVEQERFDTAIYWYRQALLIGLPQNPMAVQETYTSTLLPHIQLCYCYDRLGDRVNAKIHHEAARMYNPDHPSVVYNERYFRELAQGQLLNMNDRQSVRPADEPSDS